MSGTKRVQKCTCLGRRKGGVDPCHDHKRARKRVDATTARPSPRASAASSSRPRPAGKSPSPYAASATFSSMLGDHGGRPSEPRTNEPPRVQRGWNAELVKSAVVPAGGDSNARHAV